MTEATELAHMIIMATDRYAMLRYRRKEIAVEVHDLKARIETLQAEDAELDTAERVLSRFGAIDDEREEEAAATTAGKPAGTPTTPNMIVALLKEAVAQGKPGLEPKEMQISISKRWWPSVKSEDIGPTAWRMWKARRLAKAGPIYMLPGSSAAADLLGEDPATAE